MITVAALLSSCGVFNKVFKHKTTSSSLEETSKSVAVTTKTEIIDNSVTEVTETLDSTVKTPEVKGSVATKVNLTDLKNGLTVIDDEFVNLQQIYDPVDSTLNTSYTLKPQNVAVPKERKTVKHNDIKTTQAGEVKTKEATKKEVKKTDAIVDRKADYKVLFIIILVVCLFIFTGWLIKSKNYLKLIGL